MDRRFEMSKLFGHPNETPWTELGAGTRRRVLVHLDQLMQVEFGFDQGAIGALHKHPHVQSSYVAEGRFEVTIGDERAVLETGGSFIVPPDTMHGVKALEAGRLIDSFTPHRADFLA
jgi:quercetin dioxygenase-like cupin family protein